MNKLISGKLAVLISKSDQIQEGALELIRGVGIIPFVDIYLKHHEADEKIETKEQAIIKSATTIGFSILLEKAMEEDEGD